MTTTTDALERLAAERFVSLTTYRRSGQGVPTPVWVVPSDDRTEIVVMTPAASGKVTRLRNDPRVELRSCSRFGRVEPDSPSTTGSARLAVYDAALEQRFRDKYGLEYRLVRAAEKRTQGGDERVAVLIRLDPAMPSSTA